METQGKNVGCVVVWIWLEYGNVRKRKEVVITVHFYYSNKFNMELRLSLFWEFKFMKINHSSGLNKRQSVVKDIAAFMLGIHYSWDGNL